jgi:hypothetical protein
VLQPLTQDASEFSYPRFLNLRFTIALTLTR